MTTEVAKDQLRAFVERIDGEVWKPIDGFSNYVVSDHGRVASFKGAEPRLMRGGRGTTTMKYLRVSLVRDDGKKVARNIHVIVAEAFLGQRPKSKWALHRDGDVENCRLINIYWGTPQGNADDRVAHGRSGPRENNPNAKLTSGDVADIRSRYRAGGVTQAQLAREFGVRQAHVSRLVLEQSWPAERAAA